MSSLIGSFAAETGAPTTTRPEVRSPAEFPIFLLPNNCCHKDHARLACPPGRGRPGPGKQARTADQCSRSIITSGYRLPALPRVGRTFFSGTFSGRERRSDGWVEPESAGAV